MRTQITKKRFPTGFESPIMFFGYLIFMFSFIMFIHESFGSNTGIEMRKQTQVALSTLDAHVVDFKTEAHCEGGESGVFQKVEK